ncbi:MAG: nucleotidyltransferase family protein [Thaumarchaeota archaeon]|nr:nucleotidyltransferase family protein [Nitrososphaerota archaeon]
MKALILSGGQGLRLRPLTDDKPKPLVALNGKPIAEWQIDWLRKSVKLDEVVFLCGYKWQRLKQHFGNDYHGVRVEYSVEDTPLGTGGAIKKGLKHLGVTEGNVIVTNGDILTALPLKRMVSAHDNSDARPAATLLVVPYRSRFGVIRIDKEKIVRKFEEKPDFPDVWINGGIYVINSSKVIGHLPDKGDIERETFPVLAKDGGVLSYPFKGFWALIDSIKDLHEAEKQVKARRSL